MIKNCDCVDGLKELSDNSVDVMATDPPYGISFMSKNWDTFNEIVEPKGSYQKEKNFKKLPRQSSKSMMQFFTPIWKECHRVLKPGSFAFIMCIPRQDCLSKMIVSLEDSGFNTNFTSLYWAFASGFPKSSNISKSIDKRLGAEREVTGKYQVPSDSNAGNAGKVIRNFKNNMFCGTNETGRNITTPSTKQAKLMDGWYSGFQPKPALEIIIVAQKPMKYKSYVDQALDYSNQVLQCQKNDIAPACVNFEKCRIPYESDDDKPDISYHKVGNNDKFSNYGIGTKIPHNQGRFPSHLLISDDVLNDGEKYRGGITDYQASSIFNNKLKREKKDLWIEDKGSFSRYFSLDSWWNNKIKNLPESVQKTFPMMIVPKASRGEKNKGCEGLPFKSGSEVTGRKPNSKGLIMDGRVNNPYAGASGTYPKTNFHPTTKPVKLMSYLITLSTREKDVVIDPFLGSGTTAVACKMLNRRCIGFEISKEYYDIAKKRLQRVCSINEWL